MTMRRNIAESPIRQGVNERIAYKVDTTPWGARLAVRL